MSESGQSVKLYRKPPPSDLDQEEVYKSTYTPGSTAAGVNFESSIPKKSSATDNRLDKSTNTIQSNSSAASLPLSIPYGYIVNKTNSFDTVNMFASVHNQPTYSNTLHINLATLPTHANFERPQLSNVNELGNHPNQLGSKITPRNVYTQNTPISASELANQVPKRFLQFIADQQNPFLVHKIDGISMNSLSLYLGDPYVEHHNFGKSTTSSSSGPPKRSHDRERDISDSMGSQATIFLTRGGVFDTLKSSIGSPAPSSGTHLKRNRAIRASSAAAYRLSRKIKKWAAKLKHILFRRRRVNNRHANVTFQQTRIASGRSMNNSGPLGFLKRRQSRKVSGLPRGSLKKKNMVISVPLGNPELRELSNDDSFEIQKAKLDSDLKIQAGAQLESYLQNEAINPNNRNKDIDQEADFDVVPFSGSPFRNRKVTLISILDPNLKKPRSSLVLSALKLKELLVIRQSLKANIMDDNLEEVTVEAWRSYLLRVVASRIKLRQEINLFSLLKKDTNYKWGIPDEAASDGALRSSSGAPGDHHEDNRSLDPNPLRNMSKWSEYSIRQEETDNLYNYNYDYSSNTNYNYSYKQKGNNNDYGNNSNRNSYINRNNSTMENKTSTAEALDHFLRTVLVKTQTTEESSSESEPEITEFHNTVRHSMLGEMLDYNSDATLIVSATSSASSATISDHDLGIGSRYGTVVRRKLQLPRKQLDDFKTPVKNQNHNQRHLYNQNSLPQLPLSNLLSIKRSPGFSLNLHNLLVKN